MNARDERFLAWAECGAHLFSTCSRRQFMAIIVDVNGRVVGTGYNGAPPGQPHCTDGACPHAADPHGLSSAKRGNCIAIHAEANAIMFSNFTARRGGTLYVNGRPCTDCAKLIIGSGIERVVCSSDGVGEGVEVLAMAGIRVLVRAFGGVTT